MESNTKFDLKLLWKVMLRANTYRYIFLFVGVLTLLLAALAPLRPFMVQKALDDYILRSDYEGLIQISMLLLGIIIFETLVQFLHTFMANWLGQKVVMNLRNDVYQHCIKLKLKYFDNNPIGTLVTRTVSDIETIAEIFSQGILVIIGDVLKLIVVVAFMFWIDWRLSVICLLTIPLLLYATAVFKKAIKNSFENVRTEVSKLNSFVQERLTGMSVIQVFGREKHNWKEFSEINGRHRDAHIASVWAYSIFFPVVEILSATSLAMVVWLGSKGIVHGVISIGNLVEFILYIYMLFRPIRQLADRFNTLQMGLVAAERVFNLLEEEEIIADGAERLEKVDGAISFKDVWFAYNEQEWVLKNVSFDIAAGETLAIVGATGAGKSSIINILSRFYEFEKGTISLDGNSVRNYSRASIRSHVGVVLQDVFLFADSILNNVRLQNEDISEDQVMAAAKKVGALEFIEKLPGGLHYDVRERGAMLSVGQRQLLSFMRAYVYNPSILILDEATSSIDSESEDLIQKAVVELTKGRTSIIIAHRLSTIKNADKIMVLDKGEIVEMGDHDELLAQNGHFKRLYDAQFIKN